VNQAVAQMDTVTQASAASAEECAAAAEELSGQAEQLQGVVRDLAPSWAAQRRRRRRYTRQRPVAPRASADARIEARRRT
jgi:nitrate reductase cytochrome c-type subunit